MGKYSLPPGGAAWALPQQEVPMRTKLTDRAIKAMKPAKPGKQDDHRDSLVPGLAVRVTPKGAKSFVLMARFPLRPSVYTRRWLGDVGVMTLDQARRAAREWQLLIAKGIDPAVEAEHQRVAQARQQAYSFAAVAADFLDQHGRKLVKVKDCRATIERFVRLWGSRPVSEITALEVSSAIRIIAQRAPGQAHNAFAYLRKMYRWAAGTGLYGVEASPTDRLVPSELIGRREPRVRVLADGELSAVWDAAGLMRYPYGPCIRMLILTGQRVSEVSGASWREIDLDKALWSIPASRMKTKVAHEVPLAPQALALLRSLPRFAGGDFVFSTTAGRTPINGFSQAKERLDRLVKLAGQDAWVFHDLRRTMRTHLSALQVQSIVAELTIAHSKPGLHRVYDLHAYQDEKRHCLTLWEKRLAGILNPAEVLDLASAREASHGAV
jgi:integrase